MLGPARFVLYTNLSDYGMESESVSEFEVFEVPHITIDCFRDKKKSWEAPRGTVSPILQWSIRT